MLFFIVLAFGFCLVAGFAHWVARHERSAMRKWKKEQRKNEDSLSICDFDWKDFKNELLNSGK